MGAAKIVNLKAERGDTVGRKLIFKDDDKVAIDITGWTIYFTIKSLEDDADDDALISKTITIHVDPPGGETKVTVLAAETDDLVGKKYDVSASVEDIEACIYSHDGGSNLPNAVIGSIATGNSTSGNQEVWEKYTGLSISISGSTTYWVAVNTTSSAGHYTNFSTDGSEYWTRKAVAGITDPYTGTTQNTDVVAIYAVYTIDGAARRIIMISKYNPKFGANVLGG